MEGKGLGRNFVPDRRDSLYPIRATLPKTALELPFKYWWTGGWWGNQGSTSQCVAFSWLHWLADGPTTYRRHSHPIFKPRALYCRAQEHDPWPGDCKRAPFYNGTAVRAGAQVLQDDGYITEYRWAFTLEDVLLTLETRGPVVAGTRWTSGMDRPNKQGVIRPDGHDRGGHAYLLNGFSRVQKLIRCKNSWGRRWGRDGHFWISFDDFSDLLRSSGEACYAITAK